METGLKHDLTHGGNACALERYRVTAERTHKPPSILYFIFPLG